MTIPNIQMAAQHIGLLLQSIYHAICYLVWHEVNLVVEEGTDKDASPVRLMVKSSTTR
jgi:hypothetical protein